MIFIIIGIVVYFISVYFMYIHTMISHSYGGIWSGVDVGLMDMVYVFIPIFNTICCIISWVSFYPIRKKKKKMTYNKFFNVKNEN